MIIKPLMTGISMGVTTGAVAFKVSRSLTSKKKNIKYKARKAIKSMGDFMDDLSDMMK